MPSPSSSNLEMKRTASRKMKPEMSATDAHAKPICTNQPCLPRPRESSLVRGKHGWFVQMGLACASVALISGFIFLLAVLFISRFEEDGEGI